MNKKHSSELHNLVIALVLSTLILTYWQYFVEAPRKKADELAQRANVQTELQAKKEAEETTALPGKPRAEWLAESLRIPIKSDSLHGSIALKGLRFDDLTLARYHETLDPGSPEVTLFSPANDANGYFAQFGWLASDKTLKVPDADSLWVADGKMVSPGHPVIFSWNNKAGVTFSVKITLDDKYMFTVEQSAKDANGKPVTLQAYAYVNRVHTDSNKSLITSHEGPVGVFDDVLHDKTTYKKLVEEAASAPTEAVCKGEAYEAQSGWLGMTDKYWLSAIIPAAKPFNACFSHYVSHARDHYQVDYAGPPQIETAFYLFAGVKKLAVLDDYETRYQIALFDRTVDFTFDIFPSWLLPLNLFFNAGPYFLGKPILLTLEFFHALVGNFGIAILLLTVIVKLMMFPLANKQFKSMNQMKKLQPKMAEIKERCKDDKLKMNQEVMELYKREKVNPASGCLPIFIQVPVFFALYRVLYVTIEMRHAPFFGWIHDLSASDPSNLFTFFGLAPWGDPTFPLWFPLLAGAHLHVGLWPLLYCITMIIQQHLSPPPPDPMQAKMMKALPLGLLFLFSSFPAGLVIYWSWSNTLTILQQSYFNWAHGGGKSGKK